MPKLFLTNILTSIFLLVKTEAQVVGFVLQNSMTMIKTCSPWMNQVSWQKKQKLRGIKSIDAEKYEG